MKHSLKLFLVVLIATTAIFSACKKYEDGPAISLLTKTSRISNDWVAESATQNGINVTTGLEDFGFNIKKDGTYTSDGEAGVWEFDSNKEAVIFDKGTLYEFTFKILRLKSKELWLEYTEVDGAVTDVLEIHFKPR